VFVVVDKKAKSRQAVSLYCYKVGSASEQDGGMARAASKKPACNTLLVFKQANSHND